MSISDDIYFIEFLKERTKKGLYGLEAHKEMAPLVGEEFFRTFTPSQNSFNSAILILLNKSDYSNLQILFTLRNSNLENHAGQISFPGGHSEAMETDVETALRETYEETGIDCSNFDIIGKLSKLFVPPSNTIITPIIAFSNEKLNLSINTEEVEEAFFIPFDYFLDKVNIKREFWDFNGTKVLVPFWEIGKKTPLWGATAMILSELIRLYEEFINLK